MSTAAAAAAINWDRPLTAVAEADPILAALKWETQVLSGAPKNPALQLRMQDRLIEALALKASALWVQHWKRPRPPAGPELPHLYFGGYGLFHPLRSMADPPASTRAFFKACPLGAVLGTGELERRLYEVLRLRFAPAAPENVTTEFKLDPSTPEDILEVLRTPAHLARAHAYHLEQGVALADPAPRFRI